MHTTADKAIVNFTRNDFIDSKSDNLLICYNFLIIGLLLSIPSFCVRFVYIRFWIGAAYAPQCGRACPESGGVCDGCRHSMVGSFLSSSSFLLAILLV